MKYLVIISGILIDLATNLAHCKYNRSLCQVHYVSCLLDVKDGIAMTLLIFETMSFSMINSENGGYTNFTADEFDENRLSDDEKYNTILQISDHRIYVKKERFYQVYYFTAYLDPSLTKQVGKANCTKCELGRIYIKKDFRNRGIGTALINLCMSLDDDGSEVNVFASIKQELIACPEITTFLTDKSKVFKILMQADEYSGNAYFSAARAAKYTKVVILISHKDKAGENKKHCRIFEINTAKLLYNVGNFNHDFWYFIK